jgi:beta-glucanase (GH16 family)
MSLPPQFEGEVMNKAFIGSCIQSRQITLRALSLLCTVLILISFGSCGSSGGTNTTGSTSTGGTGDSTYPTNGTWTLQWSDEFNGTDGSSPDSTKWAFDTGSGGWGNSELETYTNSTQNAYVQGGYLNITAIKSSGTPQYTSARIKTQGKFSQKYGKFEAKIKLPFGQGIWPAFWLLGDNITTVSWPACGEIDIMENLGNAPTTVYGTVHGLQSGGSYSVGSPYALPTGKFSDDFHVFSVEWEPNVARFYVDGNLYKTVTPTDLPAGSTWAFDHPFFIILNVAVGGNWPGNPDSTTVFPQTMQVDYIRVYARQ